MTDQSIKEKMALLSFERLERDIGSLKWLKGRSETAITLFKRVDDGQFPFVDVRKMDLRKVPPGLWE